MTLEEVLKQYQILPQFEKVHLINPNQRGFEEDTPLHMACRAGEMEDIRVMLSAGADIDMQGDLGKTPLHIAVSQNNVELVKLLLEAGANVEITNESGRTPADMAEILDRPELAQLIDEWPRSTPSCS